MNQPRSPKKSLSSSAPRKVIHAAEAQEQILAAVDELFYQEGARAVGVDAVVKRAGVNKMSLYRQFASKEALLLHYLARKEEGFWAYYDRSINQHPGEPRRQLLQFFIDLSQRASKPHYRGCPFVNIAAEFPDPLHPARLAVADNKARLLASLRALAEASGAGNPDTLAYGLALLIEGAYTASQTYASDTGIMQSLPVVAEQMINAAVS